MTKKYRNIILFCAVLGLGFLGGGEAWAQSFETCAQICHDDGYVGGQCTSDTWECVSSNTICRYGFTKNAYSGVDCALMPGASCYCYREESCQSCAVGNCSATGPITRGMGLCSIANPCCSSYTCNTSVSMCYNSSLNLVGGATCYHNSECESNNCAGLAYATPGTCTASCSPRGSACGDWGVTCCDTPVVLSCSSGSMLCYNPSLSNTSGACYDNSECADGYTCSGLGLYIPGTCTSPSCSSICSDAGYNTFMCTDQNCAVAGLLGSCAGSLCNYNCTDKGVITGCYGHCLCYNSVTCEPCTTGVTCNSGGCSGATVCVIDGNCDADAGENVTNCFGDCHCGDGSCLSGIESCSNCPADCACPSCVPDGCNDSCPSSLCTVEQDPDCGCKDSDSCCGMGCTSSNDNDCAATCSPCSSCNGNQTNCENTAGCYYCGTTCQDTACSGTCDASNCGASACQTEAACPSGCNWCASTGKCQSSTCTGEGGGGETVHIKLKNFLSSDSFEDLVNSIINFVFWVAIVLTPLMILVAAYYFIIAAGDPAKIMTGKKILLWTAIGFGIVMLSKGISSVIKTILGG